jgi:hypothetical protein
VPGTRNAAIRCQRAGSPARGTRQFRESPGKRGVERPAIDGITEQANKMTAEPESKRPLTPYWALQRRLRA